MVKLAIDSIVLIFVAATFIAFIVEMCDDIKTLWRKRK